MMLKFDPDDAEDEDGPTDKPGNAAGGVENIGGVPAAAQGSVAPGAVQYPNEGLVPPITLTINAGHSDNSPDKVRVNNVQTAVSS